jgi:hypothetical protein
MQDMLPGLQEFESTDRFQEKATIELIESITQDRGLTGYAKVICKSMISLARNIDSQNQVGRETSRNMAEYRAYLDELRGIYPETPNVDESLGSLLAESSAK